MKLAVGALDLAIIAAYMAGVVGLGCCAVFVRRRGAEGSYYFLASSTLNWPVIGLAMLAVNISTVHLVSLAGEAYKYGFVYGNFVRSKVPTLPDFQERRLNRQCRDAPAVISLFSAIMIHVGIALCTSFWALRGILGLAPGSDEVI